MLGTCREAERERVASAAYEDANTLNMDSWASSFGTLFTNEASTDDQQLQDADHDATNVQQGPETVETVSRAAHKRQLRNGRLAPNIDTYTLKPGEFLPHGAADRPSATADGPAYKRALLQRAQALQAAELTTAEGKRLPVRSVKAGGELLQIAVADFARFGVTVCNGQVSFLVSYELQRSSQVMPST